MERDEPATVREALLSETMAGGEVRCGLCERRCCIAPGASGWCRTRENRNGRLVTLVYGNLSSCESRPIEIKPFFHFYPGSRALTFSTWSCNMDCPWCQNWHLSKIPPQSGRGRYVAPDVLVSGAIQQADQGLCASFQEPTLLFEYCLDSFRIGRDRGLYGCMVSNGYFTLEALQMLGDAGMHAINIDVKGDEAVYRSHLGGLAYGVVWRNARAAREMGLHVEMVCLLVTGVSARESVVTSVVRDHLEMLGPDVPLHFSRYFPSYRYDAPATDPALMRGAYETARRAGVRYPYLGNVSDAGCEDTCCPSCGTVLIERTVHSVHRLRLHGARCEHCGWTIPLVT